MTLRSNKTELEWLKLFAFRPNGLLWTFWLPSALNEVIHSYSRHNFCHHHYLFSLELLHRAPEWHTVLIAAVFPSRRALLLLLSVDHFRKAFARCWDGARGDKWANEDKIMMPVHRIHTSVTFNPFRHNSRTARFLGPGDANVTQIQPCHLVPYLISLWHSNK